METFSYFCFFLLVNLAAPRRLWEPSVLEISANTMQKSPHEAPQVQITGLTGTLLRDSLSNFSNATELRIIRNRLTAIEPGALCPSQTLKILELDLSGNKNPPTLTKSMFDNCKLDELFLKFDYDNPSEIDRNALENLELSVLAVDSLQLPELNHDFLLLEKSGLTSLVLSNIHVGKINGSAFSEFASLEELEVVHNIHLERIPVGVFRDLKKLRRLSLRDNAIAGLTWDEFEGLSQLEELDVGDNKIESFDARKIRKSFPKLKTLRMELNPIKCEDERVFLEEMKGVEVVSSFHVLC